MSLVEFLHARIDEDGQAAQIPPAEDEGWVDGQVLADLGRRLNDSCQTKRRIVEHEHHRPEKDYRPMPPTPDTPVLRLLAEQYADHPDYRQEWRP